MAPVHLSMVFVLSKSTLNERGKKSSTKNRCFATVRKVGTQIANHYVMQKGCENSCISNESWSIFTWLWFCGYCYAVEERKKTSHLMVKPARNFELCQNGRNIKSGKKDVCVSIHQHCCLEKLRGKCCFRVIVTSKLQSLLRICK